MSEILMEELQEINGLLELPDKIEVGKSKIGGIYNHETQEYDGGHPIDIEKVMPNQPVQDMRIESFFFRWEGQLFNAFRLVVQSKDCLLTLFKQVEPVSEEYLATEKKGVKVHELVNCGACGGILSTKNGVEINNMWYHEQCVEYD